MGSHIWKVECALPRLDDSVSGLSEVRKCSRCSHDTRLTIKNKGPPKFKGVLKKQARGYYKFI